MTDLVTKLRSSEYRASVSAAELRSDLRQVNGLPTDDVLDLLCHLSADLHRMAIEIPCAILDGFEARLSGDTLSQILTAATLQNMRS